MILFKKDWDLYPRAIADLQTKNRSFVDMAILFKKMGVENHLWPLALHDPSLQGVDPHSKHLTPDQMLAVALECKVNPWYYFREVARAPGSDGGQPEMFQANRGNLALYWSFFNHILFILIQIRQTGKSFSVDTLDVLLLNIMCRDTSITLLTKDDGLRARNIERLKDIMDLLPPYLKQRTKADTNNTETITINALGNSYKGHLPQASEKLANNVGRGYSSANFRADEGPFQPNFHIALPAALPAGGDARDKALKAGSPHGTILTTTAGKKDTKEGAFFYKLVTDAAPWSERFLDAVDRDDLMVMVSGSCRHTTPMINGTFNHKQLGRSDAWLAKKLSEALGSDETADSIDRDYFNRWTSGTISHPLTTEQLERIRRSERDPRYDERSSIGGYIVRWFIEENQIASRMANSKPILALDTSDASGGDDISLRVTDSFTGECLAAGTFNETSLFHFADWIATWFSRFPNIVAIIERRSSGVTLIDHLLAILPSRGIDPFRVLFNRVVHDSDVDKEAYKEASLPMGRRSSDIYVKYKKAFGFATSGSGVTSRTELYSTTLINASRLVGDRVADKMTIDQIAGLVKLNGRVNHMPGQHDDMVIGWLLTHWFLTMGKNMQHYGIDSAMILYTVRETRKVVTHETYDLEEQKELRAEMKEVVDRLNSETDPWIIQKLEHRITHLASRLHKEENEVFSADELIQQSREARKKLRPASRTVADGFYEKNFQVVAQAQRYRDPTRFYRNDYR